MVKTIVMELGIRTPSKIKNTLLWLRAQMLNFWSYPFISAGISKPGSNELKDWIDFLDGVPTWRELMAISDKKTAAKIRMILYKKMDKANKKWLLDSLQGDRRKWRK